MLTLVLLSQRFLAGLLSLFPQANEANVPMSQGSHAWVVMRMRWIKGDRSAGIVADAQYKSTEYISVWSVLNTCI